MHVGNQELHIKKTLTLSCSVSSKLLSPVRFSMSFLGSIQLYLLSNWPHVHFPIKNFTIQIKVVTFDLSLTSVSGSYWVMSHYLVNVSTADRSNTHPKHRRFCAGLWSTRRPHSTSLSSGCPYGNPCRSRSSLSPGCSRGCLFEKVRRWQLWQPVDRRTARTTSPTHQLRPHEPAKLAAVLA